MGQRSGGRVEGNGIEIEIENERMHGGAGAGDEDYGQMKVPRENRCRDDASAEIGGLGRDLYVGHGTGGGCFWRPVEMSARASGQKIARAAG